MRVTSATGREAATPGKRAIVGWALYDLANTIFSINIVSLYFSIWVVNDVGGRDGDYGLANSLSMAVMFVTAPLLGALSDQMPRRMPLLIATTIACCGFTAFLGTGGLVVSLVLFAFANYFFQAGLIFYDALLPSVSTESNRGTIGGLGVGLGYLGSLIGVLMGLTVLQADPTAKPLVFKITAALFLLFAIPCFLWVREGPRRGATRIGGEAIRRAFADLHATLTRARKYPDLSRFLFGRVFYTDAANTIIAFMGIYVTHEIGFTETQAQIVLLVGILGAVIGGFGWGRVVDRLGPKRTLGLVLQLWLVVLGLAVAIAVLHLPNALFWLVAPLAGIALGGTWAADRPYMLRLAPPRHVGQFYGLYAMVGRLAAILGPLLWTAIVDWLGWGRPAAVASLIVMVAISLVILRGVGDARRDWKTDELVPA